MDLWQELGVSGGTAILILIVGYFVIKWAVKNGIKEAFRDITGEETSEEIASKKILEQALQKYDNKK